MPRLRPFAPFVLLAAAVAAAVAAAPAADPPDGTGAAMKQIPQFRVPEGLKVELWACEPKLGSPVAISVDEKNRVYVAEEYRLGRGAAENRDNPAFKFSFFLDDDLQIRTLDDRLKVYRKWQHKLPGGFGYYTSNADQVRLLEDTTGSGKANKSSVFAGGFNQPLDGLAAGVLARDGVVYLTCIPNLWKLRDNKGEGVADEKTALLTGFGVNIAFFGHDLHGLTFGPDGRLYFSVGDRGFNVTTKEGTNLSGPRMGAVFRCEPDGTGLEVVHRGLRNPQELAFDQFGNLFADDNNCDKGDHARLVYVCDSGDSGWNMAYQTIPDPYMTGPWFAERLWHLPHAGQAAYIVPPVGKIGTGPSGFLFTSGTALPDRYKNSFIMCNYAGLSGGLEAFKVKPLGAGFEIVDYHDFLKPIKATDAEFGYDGKLYVSDFVDLNWDGTSAGGRIYTVFDPKKQADPGIVEVKALFAEGFKQRPPAELAKLLGHADQRVRQRAQFALAEKGAVAELTAAVERGSSQLERLHGVWGLWQLAKSKPDVLKTLAAMLGDGDPELRAQAAKVLGDRGYAPAADALLKLLGDDSPRVKYFAAEALGKVKAKPAAKPLLDLVRTTGDADPFLRHAAVTALARIGDVEALQAHAADPSPAVRLAVVLAYRKLGDNRVSALLKDGEILVRTEAARAVHDLPLEAEYPKLAAVLNGLGTQPLPDSDALLRRAIDANFRLGGVANAKAVLGVVTNPNVSILVRGEALNCLKDWADPPPRDRVTGFWRPLPKRDAAIARGVVQAGLNELLTRTSGRLQIDAVAAISALGVAADRKTFEGWVADESRDPYLRAAALRFLAAGPEKIATATVLNTFVSTSPVLASTARDVYADLDPTKAAVVLAKVFDPNGPGEYEQQQAVATLARMKNREAAAVLDGLAAKLADGTLPTNLKVDVWDALKASPNPKREEARKAFERGMKQDPVGKFAVSLTGGDAARGKEVFFNHTAAQCVRCHKAEGVGGTAGPDLSDVVKRYPEKTREYLLESLVLPSAQIAKGFASVTLTLADGRVLAGTIAEETPKAVTLTLPSGKREVIGVADIEGRTVPTSPMPAVDRALTHREMRDLIEYLAQRK